jgi:hypothetical protein
MSDTEQIPTYEFVAAFYADGRKAEDPAWVEFSRPEDFATRKAWSYYFFEVEQTEPKQALYKVHFWVDLLLSDEEVQGVILEVIKLGVVPDYRHDPRGYPPMSPTDCLQENDFWDSSLGEPNYCPDEHSDDFSWMSDIQRDEASRDS